MTAQQLARSHETTHHLNTFEVVLGRCANGEIRAIVLYRGYIYHTRRKPTRAAALAWAKAYIEAAA